MRYAYPWVYDSALADTSLANVVAVVKGSKLSGSIETSVAANWATLTLLGKASEALTSSLRLAILPTLSPTSTSYL